MQPGTLTTAIADGAQHVVVDGRQIHYRSAGAGPAVVLLHGWPTSAALWRHQIPTLATRMRVYAPDLPGFGESPPFAEGRCTWDGYVETVVGFLVPGGGHFLPEDAPDEVGQVILAFPVQHPAEAESVTEPRGQ